jgi:hypothetical protein
MLNPQQQQGKDKDKDKQKESPRGSSSSGGGGSGGGLAGTANTMAEINQRMLERGEKLNRVADRSAELSNAAHDFSKLAKQLNEKQSNRWF